MPLQSTDLAKGGLHLLSERISSPIETLQFPFPFIPFQKVFLDGSSEFHAKIPWIFHQKDTLIFHALTFSFPFA